MLDGPLLLVYSSYFPSRIYFNFKSLKPLANYRHDKSATPNCTEEQNLAPTRLSGAKVTGKITAKHFNQCHIEDNAGTESVQSALNDHRCNNVVVKGLK